LLVENFAEGALNLSKEAQIVYTNNYFPELLHLSYEKVIGNSFLQYVHPESKETFNELFNSSLTEITKGEINLLIGNKTIPVYISLTSLFPTIQTVGVIITDFTEKKKQEDLLKIKNAELNKLNSELQAFAHVTSHDLQTPLRKIQTYLSRITENEITKLSEDGKSYLNTAITVANRMQLLIQDLLSYSRTSTTARKFELTDLNQIIIEVKDELNEELNDKKANLEAAKLDKVHIIPFQFRQLMLNLIGNALKFSNPRQAPHIIIKSEVAIGKAFNKVKLSPQKKYCHISVSDNGIGFEPIYHEKIFEIFCRLHGEGLYKGTGIGLAIVKKIVDNHDGVITANSELNKGTTFDMYFPVTQKTKFL
jgi:PAS domain S-box-containing protein